MKKAELFKKYEKEKVEKTLLLVSKLGARRLRDKLKIKIVLKKGGYTGSVLSNLYVITDYILKNKIQQLY